MKTIKSLALALTIGSVYLFAGNPTLASDCYEPKYVYQTIIVYETVKKPCIEYVVKYDHCDEPYLVRVVSYKLVKVPVEKTIKVYY